MEDLNMNKLNESELSAVDGGAASASGVKVRPIERTADIPPTARSPRSTREATGSKSMASPLTASGTDF